MVESSPTHLSVEVSLWEESYRSLKMLLTSGSLLSQSPCVHTPTYIQRMGTYPNTKQTITVKLPAVSKAYEWVCVIPTG